MPDMIVIDDSNYQAYVNQADSDPNLGRGRVPRNYARVPYGALPHADTFNWPIPPQSEWDKIIAENDAKKLWPMDKIQRSGMKALNQGQTNFCWCNAPTNCVRYQRLVANEPFKDLSPASVACRLNGFKNQGGWGGDALKGLVKSGVNTVEEWPPNAISRQYDTDATRAAAGTRKTTEWIELKPGDMGQMFYLVAVMRIPVAVGYNWWSHEVTVVKFTSKTSGIIWNSWGDDWSAQGFGELKGSKLVFDDAVALPVGDVTEEI